MELFTLSPDPLLFITDAANEHHTGFKITTNKPGNVRATAVAVREEHALRNLCVCICNLRHPARNAHLSCLWPAPLYIFVPTLSKKRQDFRKNVTEHKMCFKFLYKFCLKHFSF
jgi:hypothetical protein